METFSGMSSFAPKGSFNTTAPSISYAKAGAGAFFKFSAFLFFASLIVFGFVFWYKNNLNRQITELTPSLERAKEVLDKDFIKQVEDASNKISFAESIVSSHRRASNIFSFLEKITYQEIRFIQFSYTYSPPSSEQSGNNNSSVTPVVGGVVSLPASVAIDLSGEATSYTALAKQAAILAKNETIKEASFSNFSLTEKGGVTFSLKIKIDPSILSI
ncbi:MAG: hypothetical protein Q7R75_00840 [bacterium]|nr:hypothetical protein [bacterium]